MLRVHGKHQRASTPIVVRIHAASSLAGYSDKHYGFMAPLSVLHIVSGGTPILDPESSPAEPESVLVRRQLGQLVVAKNPFSPGKWIIILCGISGPATLALAQMLTGCTYKEFTINSLQLVPGQERDNIEEAISPYLEVLAKHALEPQPDKCKIPYDALSEQMLEPLLEVIAASDGVNALVEVEIYCPAKGNEAYAYDERKILGWRYLNMSESLHKPWANPNDLRCTRQPVV